MNDWIKWCKCNDSILTTEQIREGKPCYRCQEESKQHAETFKKRFEKSGEENE